MQDKQKTVSHNDETITFEEASHSYTDSKGRKYLSVTTLVSQGFEKFDADKVAEICAAKQGRSKTEILLEWKEAGKTAAENGTRLHENCEAQILGEEEKMHFPNDSVESLKFKQAYDAVKMIKSDKLHRKLEPEKLVFSPKLLLAGSIDLLATNIDRTYTIFDWKNVKELSFNGFQGKKGIVKATEELDDSNYWHYALQLNLYELILKLEGYIPKKVEVKKVLNVFEKGLFNQYYVHDVMDNAKELVKWSILNRRLNK